MPADALAPYVGKTSTAMLLTEIVMVLIFHVGRFQMIAFSGDDIILKHIKMRKMSGHVSQVKMMFINI